MNCETNSAGVGNAMRGWFTYSGGAITELLEAEQVETVEEESEEKVLIGLDSYTTDSFATSVWVEEEPEEVETPDSEALYVGMRM